MKLSSFVAGLLLTGFTALEAQVIQNQTNDNVAEARINLSIDAIPVEELPAVLSKALGQPLNLIVPSDASHITLPPLRLHQVTVPELFEALQIASSPAGTAEPMYTFQQAAGNVWVFKLLQPAAPTAVSTVMESRVFPLESYLKNLKVEDITTAIQTVAEMASGPGGRPNLKFHEETGLLIASGSPEVLQVIQSVLTALGTSVQSEKEKSIANELDESRAALQSQRLTWELKVHTLEKECARLTERLEASEGQNTQLERDLVRSRAELEDLKRRKNDPSRPQ
jgi:hypothetical protein